MRRYVRVPKKEFSDHDPLRKEDVRREAGVG